MSLTSRLRKRRRRRQQQLQSPVLKAKVFSGTCNALPKLAHLCKSEKSVSRSKRPSLSQDPNFGLELQRRRTTQHLAYVTRILK
jgi:hypothetical protein